AITAADVGSTLVVDGERFTVLGIVGGLVNVGLAFNTAIAYAAGPPVVPALAGNAIAATANWSCQTEPAVEYASPKHDSGPVAALSTGHLSSPGRPRARIVQTLTLSGPQFPENSH